MVAMPRPARKARGVRGFYRDNEASGRSRPCCNRRDQADRAGGRLYLPFGDPCPVRPEKGQVAMDWFDECFNDLREALPNWRDQAPRSLATATIAATHLYSAMDSATCSFKSRNWAQLPVDLDDVKRLLPRLADVLAVTGHEFVSVATDIYRDEYRVRPMNGLLGVSLCCPSAHDFVCELAERFHHCVFAKVVEAVFPGSTRFPQRIWEDKLKAVTEEDISSHLDVAKPAVAAYSAIERPSFSEIHVRLQQELCRAMEQRLITGRGEPHGGKAPTEKEAKSSMSVDGANDVAIKLAKQDAGFVNKTVRQWAAEIEKATGRKCSTWTVQQTAFRIKTMEETGRSRKKGVRQARPKAARLVEGAVREGERDEVLKRLKQEQVGDFEPSPLDDDEDLPEKQRRVHYRKRV
jgi:hypothetical protein